MSVDRMKQVVSTVHGAFTIVIYLTSNNRYSALVSKTDGKKIRTHEGDEYGDIPTPPSDTQDEALNDAFHMIDSGGMT